MSKKIALASLLALSCSAFAGGHHSEGQAWKFALGIGATVAPEYQGAKERETKFLPYFSVRYKNIFSFDPLKGLKYTAYANQHISFGLGAAFDFGRDENDADILGGLGDIDSSFQPRVSVTLKLDRAELGMEYQTDATGDGHDGDLASISLSYTFTHGRQLILKPSLGATYGDENYMQSYFGITSEQAASSTAGLPQYMADAGFYQLNGNLTAIYNINPHWNIISFARYTRLQHDADDSPLTPKDSQTSVGLIASYNF